MAGSVNKVILIGNLGRDPEIKTFQNGGKIANFSIATSESWKDRQTGEKKERVDWHNISVQGDGLVGVVERYIKKGSKVYIEGQLRTRKWQDRDGNDRYTTEVVLAGMGGKLVMLDGASGGGGGHSRRDDDGGGWGDRGGSGSGRGAGNFGGGNSAPGGGGWNQNGAGGRPPFDDDLDDDVPF